MNWLARRESELKDSIGIPWREAKKSVATLTISYLAVRTTGWKISVTMFAVIKGLIIL